MSNMRLDWSAGGWNAATKRYIADEVYPAVEIADDYVTNVLGLENPVAHIGVYRTNRGWHPRGGSVSVRRIDLYLTEPEYRYRKLGNLFGEISATLTHECVHSIREQFFEDCTFAELVVTEGIAHVAQSWIEQDVFDIPHGDTVLGVGLDPSNLPDLLGEFVNDPIYGWAVPPTDEAVRRVDTDKWFEFPDHESRLSWGVLLGSALAEAWLEEGYDFPALVRMDPEDFLRI